jgi:hypothetical protein
MTVHVGGANAGKPWYGPYAARPRHTSGSPTTAGAHARLLAVQKKLQLPAAQRSPLPSAKPQAHAQTEGEAWPVESGLTARQAMAPATFKQHLIDKRCLKDVGNFLLGLWGISRHHQRQAWPIHARQRFGIIQMRSRAVGLPSLQVGGGRWVAAQLFFSGTLHFMHTAIDQATPGLHVHQHGLGQDLQQQSPPRNVFKANGAC